MNDEERTNFIMVRMGFAPADVGQNVSALRKEIGRQVREHGLTDRSDGTWAPEHGPRGMKLSAEDRARAFLELEWELAQGHYCKQSIIDPPFGWRCDLLRKKWRYEIVFSDVPTWIGDCWRSGWLSLRVWFKRRVLRRRNPYSTSA